MSNDNIMNDSNFALDDDVEQEFDIACMHDARMQEDVSMQHCMFDTFSIDTLLG